MIKPLKFRKDKKAVNELVGYVLLVALAISLSIMVYYWLRAYVIPSQPKLCPDGVGLVVDAYACQGGNFNLTLRNKGLFNIEGYTIRINNETDLSGNPRGLPYITLESLTLPVSLKPGNTISREWPYKALHDRIVEFEVQPFRLEGNSEKKIFCGRALIRQQVNNCN